jgi:hypothetical protein
VFTRLEEMAEEYYENEYADTNGRFCHAFVTMTLIKEPEEQVPGLIDFLVTKGWQIDQEGINPKTENTIVHMSMKLQNE